MTPVGLAASFAGGVVVGVAYYVSQQVAVVDLQNAPPQWPLVLYGGVAGLLGSMLDSLLGAHMQYSGRWTESLCVCVALHPEPSQSVVCVCLCPLQALTAAWGRW